MAGTLFDRVIYLMVEQCSDDRLVSLRCDDRYNIEVRLFRRA